MSTTPTTPAPLPPVLPPIEERHLAVFRKVVGQAFVLTSAAERKVYECDACLLIKTQPDCIVLPENTEQLSQIVEYCHQHQIPVTPRGAGTGLSGGALTPCGGVLLGLNRLNQILDVNLEDHTARVQAGTVNSDLNQHLKGSGFFFAPDPSSQSASTIGGNIAENAGGIHCIKYGVTHQHILSLKVVLPNGTLIETGTSSLFPSGLNLTQLLCGSEGTLGIIAEATVKLTPQPQSCMVYLAAFPSIQHAGHCVNDIIQNNLNPAALEFMDAFTVKAVNAAFDVGFPEDSAAVLLVEIDGSSDSVPQAHTTLTHLFNTHFALEIREATTESERHALWQARKKSVAAYGRYYPAFYLHDCVIPRSQISHVLTQIEAISQQYNAPVGNVFHAGDGNLHPNILFDPNDADMVTRVLKAGEEILKVCLKVGGTLSGEHGIGMEKSEYMGRIFTPEDLDAMHQLRHVFNPTGLLNPNKILPHRSGCGETHIQTPEIKRQALALNPSDTINGNNGIWI